MEKKMDKKQIMEKIVKVSMLAYELSIHSDDEETENNLPTAFLQMSGHVGCANIQLYPEGWGEDKPYITFVLYYHYEYGNTPDQLAGIIAEMERLVEIRYKLENPEVE